MGKKRRTNEEPSVEGCVSNKASIEKRNEEREGHSIR